MAFSLASERPSAAAVSTHPLRAFVAWIADQRAKHARRVALSNLLDFDAALLADLGIDRNDVIEALRRPSGEAAQALHARRARASSDWLAHP